MESFLVRTPISGLLMWVAIYISDYYLTLAITKAFKGFDAIRFEGSMELTPQFREDVEGQNPVSRRHVTYLVMFSILIVAVWYLAVKLFPFAWFGYSFILGVLILSEVVVHMRHFRNGYLIRVLHREGGMNGSVVYAERFSYLMSAFDFYSFAVLFFACFLWSYSFFFLGGAVACLRIGVYHGRLAKKLTSQPGLSTR